VKGEHHTSFLLFTSGPLHDGKACKYQIDQFMHQTIYGCPVMKEWWI